MSSKSWSRTIVAELITLAVLFGTPAYTAPQPLALSGTCKSVAPCVSTLQAYSSKSAFCSTWLNIKPKTVVTSTTSVASVSTVSQTTTTGTSIITADAVTSVAHAESVLEHAVSETIYAHAVTEEAPTPTVTAHVSVSTVTTVTTAIVCGNAKRQARTIPAPLKAFKSSVISSGCSCLNLPTSTTTSTATVLSTSTTTLMVNAVSLTTTTPVVEFTPRFTSTPTITTVITPTSTITPEPVTTTPVSTSTYTSTSTLRVGAAQVLLANPTPITPVQNGLATQNLDDPNSFPLNVPFDISLFGTTSRTINVNVNGWIGVGTQADSNTYVNRPLPNAGAGDASFAIYWSDLYIYQNTAQGIYYEITGEAPHRQLSVEFFMSFFGNRAGYTHFIVNFFESQPGRVVYTYFQTTSQKASTNNDYGTIGVQRSSTGQSNQYSFGVQPREGLSLEYNPNSNSWSEYGGTC